MGDLKTFLLSWSLEPTVLVGVGVAAFLYWQGWRRLRGRGRGGRYLKAWRAWCYAAGLVTVLVALVSPIATFTSLFFHMHMIQHVLLVMIAAPLLWLGAPMLPTMWAFSRGNRRRIGRLFHEDHPVHRVFHFLTRPGVALTLFVVVLIGWHHPGLYDAAQGRSLIHDLEHALFFGTALLFWWPVIHPTGTRRRLAYGAAILYLFPAKLAGFTLGAFLSLTGEPFYRTYIEAPRLWGLSALGDQQLGGLIMWVVSGLLFILPVLVLVMMMMHEDEGDIWIPAAVRARDSAAIAESTTA